MAGAAEPSSHGVIVDDEFEIEAAPFTLPLRNTLTRAAPRSVSVKAL